MGVPGIRRAELSDALPLTELAERTFRDAFSADNRPSDMDLYCLQAFSEATQVAEIADPSIETLLVTDRDGASIGYAQLRDGPAPVDITGPAPIELARFYVERAWHGRGIAPRLMTAIIDAARARRAKTLWLGVWEHNVRAVAFYCKFGFVDVGAHEFRLGSDIQTDRLMARSL
jgi:ribosomal protein S18 acetylase RimI-like enzyme